MSPPDPTPITEFTVESLRVVVFEDRAQAGRAAAAHVAAAIQERQENSGRAHLVLAASPSQGEFFASLIARRGLDWSRVVAFQMNEYLGIDADHPASLRRYLREHLFRLVGLPDDRLRLIPGERVERPLQVCLEYGDALRAEPPHIVCAGIGENGHLAFNAPYAADFSDPVLIKAVRLDPATRAQQVHNGSFEQVEDVPTHAYTLTVPALLSAPTVSVIVPGPRKADAVLATLRGPFGESCPATSLRRHPDATLFLDRDSARLVL